VDETRAEAAFWAARESWYGMAHAMLHVLCDEAPDPGRLVRDLRVCLSLEVPGTVAGLGRRTSAHLLQRALTLRGERSPEALQARATMVRASLALNVNPRCRAALAAAAAEVLGVECRTS
jgi:hypothetical protein